MILEDLRAYVCVDKVASEEVETLGFQTQDGDLGNGVYLFLDAETALTFGRLVIPTNVSGNFYTVQSMEELPRDEPDPLFLNKIFSKYDGIHHEGRLCKFKSEGLEPDMSPELLMDVDPEKPLGEEILPTFDIVNRVPPPPKISKVSSIKIRIKV